MFVLKIRYFSFSAYLTMQDDDLRNQRFKLHKKKYKTRNCKVLIYDFLRRRHSRAHKHLQYISKMHSPRDGYILFFIPKCKKS